MESILDDLDAMIGELDDLNFNPNEIVSKFYIIFCIVVIICSLCDVLQCVHWMGSSSVHQTNFVTFQKPKIKKHLDGIEVDGKESKSHPFFYL